MKGYGTIEEKALEWNVSTRHIQYLCRSGRVEGAVKRAGAWFIPEETRPPIKNTKSGTKDFVFVGTKGKIFNSAIELFLIKGFNSVSMKDISGHTGIRQSTLYNHFRSKQEILDSIYDFYCYYYTRERISLENMDTALQEESLEEIVKYIRYEFKEKYQQKMTDISKIIFQRISVDARAREIAKSLIVDEGIKYVEDVFNNAVDSGRLAPFDTHIMAVFFNSVRIFTFYCWIITPEPSPDSMTKLLEDEQELYKYALKFLIDLKHPECKFSSEERSL